MKNFFDNGGIEAFMFVIVLAFFLTGILAFMKYILVVW